MLSFIGLVLVAFLVDRHIVHYSTSLTEKTVQFLGRCCSKKEKRIQKAVSFSRMQTLRKI